MKRSAIKRKRATTRRRTAPSCNILRCKNRPVVGELCISHAEQRADKLFSRFVRNRDGGCTANFDHECDGVLQAAHIVGRRNQAVRYDPRNVHALCRVAHAKVDQHTAFGIKANWAIGILGFDEFNDLTEDSRATVKRIQAASDALSWLEGDRG